MELITRDSGANLKTLKNLENKGLIKIYDVKSENVTPKVKNKVPAILVWDLSTWDGSDVFTDETGERVFNDIVKIIGKNKIEDTRKLEAHVRSKNDYFITEDTDFLKHRIALEERFKTKIFTPDELSDHLSK